MASRRRPVSSQNPKLNYRPSDARSEAKGTKPTTDPTSIKEILTIMVLFVCKKILFYNTTHRVYFYLGALFLVSLISDVATIPKSFLSRSDNIFNQYFVKYAWGWNLLLLLPYVVLSSFVYCCGEKDKIIKHHLSRIGISTFFWYFWTNAFNYIETNYGKCSIKGSEFGSKQSCLKAGHFWNGFDISGHSFILIYGSLMILEETRSIVNWDSIKEFLRLEDHYRSINDSSISTNPLRSLTREQFLTVQKAYEKFTPYIRTLFIILTLYSLLWDLMLFSTMVYYHVMIEKLLGGAIAVFTWFLTYKVWYAANGLPKLPGEGSFKYIKSKPTTGPATGTHRRRTGSIVNGNQPSFMGRPLYSNRADGNNLEDEQSVR